MLVMLCVVHRPCGPRKRLHQPWGIVVDHLLVLRRLVVVAIVIVVIAIPVFVLGGGLQKGRGLGRRGQAGGQEIAVVAYVCRAGSAPI